MYGTVFDTTKVYVTAGDNTNGNGFFNAYAFFVIPMDVVEIYWAAGSSQQENAFIIYYADAPPSPVFTTSNTGPVSWSGSNALVFRVIGGSSGITNGTLLFHRRAAG